MSRSSPGVRRIVAILNFFADHPGESFTLTDIVRALKLSRATCHGLLTGLVDAGYLYRSSNKSYVLGPAIIAIGEVAKEHFSPLRVAIPEMRALADRFDLNCMVSFREGTDAVVRERATSRSNVGYTVPRGTRLPLLPQFASVFFTRASAELLNEWMDMLDPEPSEHQRQLGLESQAFGRENGYCLAIQTKPLSPFTTSTDWIRNQRENDAPLAPLSDIDADKTYDLSWIGAPVLDGDETAFAVTLQGFNEELSGAKIDEIGKELVQVCTKIGRFLAHPSSR